MIRCFLCHMMIRPGATTVDCPGCGARFPADGYDAERFRTELAATVEGRRIAIVRGRAHGPSGWSLDVHALKAAASRRDRTLLLPRLFRYLPTRWTGWPARTGRARQDIPPRNVALGCIARPGEADALVAFAKDYRHLFGRLAFVIDGTDAEALAIERRVGQAAAGHCDVAVAAAPLDGDFGAQRNRVQALADRPWILHLDTDERPDPAMIRNLGWIAADADRNRSRVIAFPRLNLVDGAPSAFYPDIQFRLVRADVRFTRKVHETPLDGVHWRDIQLSLAGRIEHRLSSARVRARSVQYEAIAAGGGKPDDERLLLTPADGDF